MSIATKAANATLALQGQGRVEASAPPPSSRDSVLVNSPAVRRTADVQFDAGSGAGNRPGSHAAPQLRPSDDSRYVRFVEAVQALRINLDQTTLPPAQVERMMESAREIFKLDDGIPRPVRPSEPDRASPPEAAADEDGHSGAEAREGGPSGVAAASGSTGEDAAPADLTASDAVPAKSEPEAAQDDWEPVMAPAAGAGRADNAETGASPGADGAVSRRTDAAGMSDAVSPGRPAVGPVPSPGAQPDPGET